MEEFKDTDLTFYHREVLRLHEAVYGRSYLWERVREARRFVDSNFNRPIDLDMLAREACLSKFHFIRLFKSYYGRTPYQYLTEVRIARAKVLLQSGMAVVDVCEAVGFVSVTSFSSLYRRMTGKTPGNSAGARTRAGCGDL